MLSERTSNDLTATSTSPTRCSASSTAVRTAGRSIPPIRSVTSLINRSIRSTFAGNSLTLSAWLSMSANSAASTVTRDDTSSTCV